MSDCKYHDICSLPDDADHAAQLCTLHSQNPDKDTRRHALSLIQTVFLPQLGQPAVCNRIDAEAFKYSRYITKAILFSIFIPCIYLRLLTQEIINCR